MPDRDGRRMLHRRAQRGVTLLELMIAITLVAAISAGLLMAMHTSLLVYEKVNHRLDDNRRVLGLERTLESQVSDVMPVQGSCATTAGPLMPVSVFNGDAQSLRFVSSFSMAEGARGYPRLVEYQVAPDPSGGVRLMMNERIYTGPAGIAPLCLDRMFLPIQLTQQSIQMAGNLALCQIDYQVPVPDSPLGGAWVPAWNRPNLPHTVRIEMNPLHPDPAGLPMLTLTVPIRVTRQVGVPYPDYLQ
jgi:prepilin-type N-terminal cleavage/methylation domain-containing protein